jgi:hypothetical protein
MVDEHDTRYSPLIRREEHEGWRNLCDAAANEKDPDKFMELVEVLNRVLDQKEARLWQQRADRQGAT